MNAIDLVSVGLIAGVSAALGIWAIFKLSLSAYFTEKAKNFATKQDVGEITKIQEEVRAEFAKLLEWQRQQGQLRLAVVERRFQAHQEAHTLWLKLMRSVYNEKCGEVVMECQRWWQENSLYLNADVRQAFWTSYHAAFNHSELGSRLITSSRL